MRNYRIYLDDILSAMDSIEKFVKGMNLDEFREDDKTSSAVIRKFEIIGEATKNLPEEIKKEYSDVPWREMAGMRDKLIHFYFGIDYELVWTTIKQRIPNVKTIIKSIKEKI